MYGLNQGYESKVCILLAAYNGEAYIEEQIRSIYAQNSVNVSLFVSVDLSKDRTLDICQSLKAEFQSLHILEYGKRYGSAGANFLRLLTEVDFSAFEFVALADQDDIWLSDKIKYSIETMQASDAGAVSTDVTAFWLNGSECLITKSQPQVEYDYLFESAGPGCTYLLSLDTAQKLQVFLKEHRENFGLIHWHDWLIYAFCRSRNIKWVISPVSTMRYRQHGNNDTGANSGLKPFLDRVKKILFGDGLKLVINQAEFLGLSSLEPIKRLVSGKRTDFLWLAANSFRFRRKLSEKMKAFTAFIILSVKGR